MELTLTYRGPLKATQRDPRSDSSQPTKHRELKHRIRLSFHRQLKRFWNQDKFLLSNQSVSQPKPYHVSSLANANKIGDWQFVPLATKELELACDLDIHMLRMDHNSDKAFSGDIDNRLKTIIDTLRIPNNNDGYSDFVPAIPDNPLYCLLEDDKIVRKISVSTDVLLDNDDDADISYVNLYISVKITPKRLIFNNIGF
jgi:hypothetical protein